MVSVCFSLTAKKKMKKTSKQQRAAAQHFDVMTEFLTNLSSLFPECAETKDALLYVTNVCKGDEKLMREAIEAWCVNMREPLKKGCAKYMKAVESITGAPACVYHAFAYRDVNAIDASTTSDTLRRIQLTDKIRSDVFTPETLATCWEYVDELNKTAHEAVEEGKYKDLPVVPTRDQIQEDIARRRAGKSGISAPTVSSGVKESIVALFAAHGTTLDLSEEEIVRSIHDAASALVQERTVADWCREKDGAKGFESLRSAAFGSIPWDGCELTDPQWDELNKAIGLCTMKANIPQPMMSGIETVANQLVKDMANGTMDLASLDAEAIGQQVLSKVSPEEMETFAQNIDKILPALGGLKPF